MTMDGAPSCWANLMNMEAVETARIPPSRTKGRVVRGGEGFKAEALISFARLIVFNVLTWQRFNGIVSDMLEIRPMY